MVGRPSNPPGRRRARHEVAALSVAGQQHGMVATRRRGHARATGEALERHRVRARRGLAASRSSGARPRGPRPCGSVPVPALTITKLSWLHRTEPDALGADAPCLPAPRLAHVEAHGSTRDRPRRCVGHGVLVARSRSGIGSTSSRSSAASSTGSRWCLRCSVPPTAPGSGRRVPAVLGRVRHGRQHGRGAGHRARRRRDRHVARYFRAPSTP